MPTLSFDIDAMTCAGCAARAERALGAVDGVRAARVNFATGAAQVDLENVQAEALRGALGAAGYPAVEERITLRIDGMTCAGCAARIEKALGAVPGVLSAPGQFR